MRWPSWGHSRSVALAVASAVVASLASGYWYLASGMAPPIGQRPIAAYILESNSRFEFKDGVLRSEASVIHRIEASTALAVDEALRRVAERAAIPPAYLAAYVCQESTGDPKAEYRNTRKWRAAGSEREKFAVLDIGLVQISGRNLMKEFPGSSPEELRLKAEDVEFAAAYLADHVASNLKWAAEQDIDAIADLPATMRRKAKEPFWLAALAYNRGRLGALAVLANPYACRHADLVMMIKAEIDRRMGAGEPAVAWSDPALDKTLPMAIGEISSRVEGLQGLLNARPDVQGKVTADGNFGPATRAAVREFQRAQSLELTGVVDDKTWAAITGSEAASRGGLHATLALGSTGRDVEELQALLNEQPDTAPKLKVDGKFGTGTSEAVSRLQQAKGVEATGIVDEQTWGLLAPERPLKSRTRRGEP